MCEPLTIMAGLSTALGVFGGISQGNAQAKAAEHQAKTYEVNAEIQEYQARDAVIRGNAAEKEKRIESSIYAGEQRAAQAANGIDTTYGSALDLAVDTARNSELDALTIRSNAYREAYGHRVGAQNSRTSAIASRAQGANAKKASLIGAGSTLLSGAANGYSTFKSNTATI